MTEFTPIASFIGGALIGLSAVLLLALEGRIAGISGIASRLFPPTDSHFQERLAFILGLVLSPALVEAVTGEPVLQAVSSNYPLLVVAGLLVGFGAVLGGGCTSGHGVCGLSRLSPRSIVATLVFMLTAFVTVYIVRHVIGG
ncbi:YeeE/YedE family protein [Pseudochelatococcus contaminans]|uniref:Sulphur transport domain-containing protein n=1 Tax=Pseudochelatococcus contaminans TaxID=1538103 RepID=A0A7W6EG53_9HYPH|nr:YeeE/YedE family protein [Pseudochelatococcus contaminans]MBB3809223.1 hypothetical protein [Pseudochelatococcus contaminans]